MRILALITSFIFITTSACTMENVESQVLPYVTASVELIKKADSVLIVFKGPIYEMGDRPAMDAKTIAPKQLLEDLGQKNWFAQFVFEDKGGQETGQKSGPALHSIPLDKSSNCQAVQHNSAPALRCTLSKHDAALPDSLPNARLVGIFYSSPHQVNYILNAKRLVFSAENGKLWAQLIEPKITQYGSTTKDYAAPAPLTPTEFDQEWHKKSAQSFEHIPPNGFISFHVAPDNASKDTGQKRITYSVKLKKLHLSKTPDMEPTVKMQVTPLKGGRPGQEIFQADHALPDVVHQLNHGDKTLISVFVDHSGGDGIRNE